MPLPKNCPDCDNPLVTEARPANGEAMAFCLPCLQFSTYKFAPCPPIPPVAACPECKSLNGTITAENLRHRDPTKPEVQFRCWDCEKWFHLKGRDALTIVKGIMESFIPKANGGGKPWLN